jgi:hypothetical protein
MTAPEPEPADDSYPPEWKTADILRREEALETPDVEAYLGSLTAVEFQQLVTRARGGVGR